MSLSVAFPLLVAIFCCLIGVLYIYNKLRYTSKRSNGGRSSQSNSTVLAEWLANKQVQLPTLEQVLVEINKEAVCIKSLPVAMQKEWTQLKIEHLLDGTDIPQFEITDIDKIESDIFKCNVLVQWPSCIPGIEISVQIDSEQIICHLQVDWIIINGCLTFREIPGEKGVVMSWEQVMPPSSAMSCLVVAPPHWKADVDIMKPLNEDIQTQMSEALASSVTEGFIELIKRFKLDKYQLLPLDELAADNETVSLNNDATNDTVTAAAVTHSNDVAFNTPKTTPLIVKVSTPTDTNEITSISSFDATPISHETEPMSMQQNGGMDSPKATKQWVGELPIINEPDKEEYTPPKSELSNSSPTEQSPSTATWRRNTSYEHLETITAPPPTGSSDDDTTSHTSNSPTAAGYISQLYTPPSEPVSYLKAIHSEDNLVRSNDRLKRRSITYSVRSYDTDSPITTSSVHLPSTLVYEIHEGNHVRHIVAITATHSTKLRKILSEYTKLHIYNDHTFTATHIKGKHVCCVCQEKVTGLFGKQCYICRDCSCIVHKECHFKIEMTCLKSKVSQMCLIYPDNISSISQM